MATNNSQQRLAYSVNQPLSVLATLPIVSNRAPTGNDKQPLGTLWINKTTGNAYIITQLIGNVATWTNIGAAAGGPLNSLTTTDDGMVVVPAGGTIDLQGDGTTIEVTNVAPNTVGFALANSPVIAGTLTVTGLLTANGGETIHGALIQSGGNVTINDDAVGATLKFGTGSAAKLVTIGSQSGASSLSLNSGSGNMTATSTGSITMLAGGIATFSSIDNAAGAVTIRTNAGTSETILINSVQGTSASSINISSTAGGVTVTSALATANAINLTASNAAGGLTSTVGTGGYSFTATNGNIVVNAGTGTISIGTDASASTIDIGTGAAAKTVVIGSTNTTSSTAIDSGSGGVNVNASVNQPTFINTGTSTGAVSIGNSLAGAITITSGTGNVSIVGSGNTINVGADAAANAVNVGSNTNGALTTIKGGNGTGVGTAAIIMSTAAAGDIEIGTPTHTGAIFVGTSTAAGGETVNIANAATGGNVAVNILSGVGTAGASTLALGNNTRVTTIGLGNIAPAAARITTINGGNSAQNDTVNILAGAPSAGTQTVNIMSGVATGGTQVVNIATGASANTVNIGNSTGASAVVVNSGTGGIKLNGGQILEVTNVNNAATPYALLGTDQFIAVDPTAGVVSITLPASPVTGRFITVYDATGQAAAHTITVNGNGKNISSAGVSAATATLTTAFSSLNLWYNGTIWNAQKIT